MSENAYNIKDPDAAQALVASLKGISNELNELNAAMKAKAEEISAIDGTMQMNDSIADWIVEAVDTLVDTAAGLEDAGKQLEAIVNADGGMDKHHEQHTLTKGL